ncbi:hypothetical protein DV738_g4237, partial [Chaetothyriales sp. CBS 135597]
MIACEKPWSHGVDRLPNQMGLRVTHTTEISRHVASQSTTAVASAGQDTSDITSSITNVQTPPVAMNKYTPNSRFFDKPVTRGPFDEAKYRKHENKTSYSEKSMPSNRDRISTAREPAPSQQHRTRQSKTDILRDRDHAKQIQHTNPAVALQVANIESPIPTAPKAETSSLSAPHSMQKLPHLSPPAGNPSKPHTAGRPLAKQPEAYYEYDRVEHPADRLKRVQQAAKIQGRLDVARRGNKHDTASPEVLAYIRKQLEPHLVELVHRRIQHYWAIGNDGLAATEAPDVQPTWPAGIYEPESGGRKSLQQKWPVMASSPEDGYKIMASRKQNARQVPTVEMVSPPGQGDSNAWGSASSGGMAIDSNASVRVESGADGSEVNSGPAIHLETDLVGWDGKMQPPPVDWTARPRFDYTSDCHIDYIDRWGEEVLEARTRLEVPPDHEVLDVTKHADGLGFLPPTETINERNASYYDYSLGDEDLLETLKTVVPVSEEELRGNAIVELDDAANNPAVDETTEILVQRWIAQNGWLNSTALPKLKKTAVLAPPAHYQPAMTTDTARVRIVLRPATEADLPGMTEIYNWYIEHSPRPSELETIDVSSMQQRLEDSQSGRLPIIVAVARSRKRGKYRGGFGEGRPRGRRNGHGHPSHQHMTEDETILGWACASDFAARDYIERTSAECELYVAHDSCRLGIGKALMDKLLEACDRGHIPSGECDWRCAPDQQHLYTAGGGRELHKIFFSVKKFNKPIAGNKNEYDWDSWLKPWLESWGFKQEAALSKMGAKHGRFIDIVYMTRETMWQPQEGHIPNPLAGTY